VLMAGAKGYVLKTAGAADVLEAIHMVYHGKSFFSEEVSNQIMASMMRPSREKAKKTIANRQAND